MFPGEIYTVKNVLGVFVGRSNKNKCVMSETVCLWYQNSLQVNLDETGESTGPGLLVLEPDLTRS